MARVKSDEELQKMQINEVQTHLDNMEVRVRRILRLLDKEHKVNMLHDLKHKLLGKDCAVCKELEGLR